MTRTKSSPRWLALAAVAAIVAAACSPSDATTAPAPETASPGPAGPTPGQSAAPTEAAGPQLWTPDPAKLAAAQAEGGLTTIALPPTWCNYQDLIAGYTSKTGIAINGLKPTGGSQQEVDAIKASLTKNGPPSPDVIDIALSFAPSARNQKLLRPYKVSTWDSIPASAKDADGYWYGDYYGVLSFEVNTDVQPTIPTDWSDLLDAAYHGEVALSGNPLTSNEAVAGVWSAAFANGGGGGDAAPGLEFFKQLHAAGNFVPVVATIATVVSGATPVRLAWTYDALADRDAQAGTTNIAVVVPKTGRLGGMYAQAISVDAPHPNAAELWMDWLYSDEGQNLWLKGYCHPIRYDDMVSRGVVPEDVAARLPDSSGVVLPTLDQVTKATTTITTGWPKVVGVVVGH